MVTKLGKSESYCLFGASGAMEQNERVHIHKGTIIHAYGYGMNYQRYVVYDENMNAVEICDGDPDNIEEGDLDTYFSPLHHLEETTRPHSKKFGIGFYYDESNEVVSDEVIQKSLLRAENLKKLQEEVAERKKKEVKELEQELIKEFSYLQRVKEPFDHKTCGKNIRMELKRNFPHTKFSVRYESFSGGDAYNIDWTDGPTVKQVDEIVKKYGDRHPDKYSQGDYWDTHISVFNSLYGSVGYVMTQKDVSEEACAQIEGQLRQAGLTDNNVAEKGRDCANAIGAGDTIHGCHYWNGWSVRDLAHVIARNMDLTPKEPASVKVKINADDITIVEGYSAKAFAVVGNTRPIKDELKRLGGRFNGRLTCGAGWVFPNTKLQEVREAIA